MTYEGSCLDVEAHTLHRTGEISEFLEHSEMQISFKITVSNFRTTNFVKRKETYHKAVIS